MFNPFKIEIEGEEEAILSGGANHMLSGAAVGGKMVLLRDSLVFKSHIINFQPHELRMPLVNIANVDAYSILNVIPTGLEVILTDGTVERFVVDNRANWIEAILAAKQ